MQFVSLRVSRFFISAPNVFHVGVKEKVFVQNKGEKDQDCTQVNLWLEYEQGGIVSNTAHVDCNGDEKTKLAELKV